MKNMGAINLHGTPLKIVTVKASAMNQLSSASSAYLRTKSPMNQFSWVHFFMFGYGQTFTAYIVLQTIATIVFERNRIIVSAALPVMLVALLVSVLSFYCNSNMWPILLILLSPIAIGYVVLTSIWFLYRKRKQRMGESKKGTP